jgi:hypothetical protein
MRSQGILPAPENLAIGLQVLRFQNDSLKQHGNGRKYTTFFLLADGNGYLIHTQTIAYPHLSSRKSLPHKVSADLDYVSQDQACDEAQ